MSNKTLKKKFKYLVCVSIWEYNLLGNGLHLKNKFHIRLILIKYFSVQLFTVDCI